MSILKIAKQVFRTAFPVWTEKRSHKKRYDRLAGETADIAFSFMNYGYCPISDDGELPALDSRDEDFKYHIHLYHHVANQITIKDLNVLEVGSGRGGGAYYMKKYLSAAAVTGVDLSEAAVELCRANFPLDKLSFTQGDAERLPFEDNSFDVVVNIESSHCYPDLLTFFKEVKRVLRPKGHFLYADFGDVNRMKEVENQLLISELVLTKTTDITENVVKSIEVDNQRREEVIRSVSEDDERFNDLANFSRLVGTEGYQNFCQKQEIYKSFLLEKP